MRDGWHRRERGSQTHVLELDVLAQRGTSRARGPAIDAGRPDRVDEGAGRIEFGHEGDGTIERCEVNLNAR